jgi:hypothetical protein
MRLPEYAPATSSNTTRLGKKVRSWTGIKINDGRGHKGYEGAGNSNLEKVASRELWYFINRGEASASYPACPRARNQMIEPFGKSVHRIVNAFKEDSSVAFHFQVFSIEK